MGPRYERLDAASAGRNQLAFEDDEFRQNLSPDVLWFAQVKDSKQFLRLAKRFCYELKKKIPCFLLW